MVYCCVPLCTSRSGLKVKGVSFHKFPSDEVVKSQWLKNIARRGKTQGSMWTPNPDSRICSKHFTDDCFSISTTRRTLLPQACPTVFEGYPEHLKIRMQQLRQHRPQKQPEAPASSPSKRVLNQDAAINVRSADVPLESRHSCEDNAGDGNRQTADKAVQVMNIKNVAERSHYDPEVRRKMKNLHNRVRKLKLRAENLRGKNRLLLQEVHLHRGREIKKSKITKQYEKLMHESRENGSQAAAFILEQFHAFGKKKCKSYDESTLKICFLLERRSPKAYRFLRKLNILHLPDIMTLKRFNTKSTKDVPET